MNAFFLFPYCLINKTFISIVIFFFAAHGYSQQTKDSSVVAREGRSHPNKQRILLVSTGNVVLSAASFVVLNRAWYANYPRSSFHFFNDNKEWNQMDKIGHVWSAYQGGRVSAEMWKWTGLKEKQSTILAALTGLAYESIIEIQDGFSSQWGFSWGDILSNFAGSALYIGQELKCRDQRIQVKLSYWPYDYNSADLIARRNQYFGNSTIERILKDYNSQTYWLSVNVSGFLPSNHFPKWLNIALGYSADGMFGGRENKWTDREGNAYDRTDIPRLRRFYISPDIDLTKINARSKIVRIVFFALNMIKIPAPAIELNSKGIVRLHGVYF